MGMSHSVEQPVIEPLEPEPEVSELEVSEPEVSQPEVSEPEEVPEPFDWFLKWV
jgi:hypothetical protein